jgi:hypothetical protein
VKRSDLVHRYLVHLAVRLTMDMEGADEEIMAFNAPSECLGLIVRLSRREMGQALWAAGIMGHEVLEFAESIMSKKAVYRLGIGWIEDLTEDLLFRQRRAL